MTAPLSKAVALMDAKLTGKVWVTNDKWRLYPQEMTDSHLLNTHRALRLGRIKRAGCSGYTNEQWIEIFAEEIVRRGLAPLDLND